MISFTLLHRVPSKNYYLKYCIIFWFLIVNFDHINIEPFALSFSILALNWVPSHFSYRSYKYETAVVWESAYIKWKGWESKCVLNIYLVICMISESCLHRIAHLKLRIFQDCDTHTYGFSKLNKKGSLMRTKKSYYELIVNTKSLFLYF